MIPLKTIDVAIGIALLYLLITFAASVTVEMISTLRNWRAQMLHDAIRNMLGRNSLVTVADVYENPQILGLFRGNAATSWLDLFEPFGWRPHDCYGTPPSYIPAATFSGAVVETVINKTGLTVEDLSPDGAIGVIRTVLVKQQTAPRGEGFLCKQGGLRSVLETTLITQGNSIQAVRFAIEKWFNDSMDRTSGWYKRRTQCCLLLIGLLVAFGGNVNSIAVARWLWQGDAARQAALAAASEFVKNGAQDPKLQEPNKSGNLSKTSDGTRAAAILEVDRELNALQYPIGWKAVALKDDWTSWIPEYAIGGLITALAISMGSTFWFDAVQSLLKIRATGPKPGSR